MRPRGEGAGGGFRAQKLWEYSIFKRLRMLLMIAHAHLFFCCFTNMSCRTVAQTVVKPARLVEALSHVATSKVSLCSQ